jgi:hypothetical protein
MLLEPVLIEKAPECLPVLQDEYLASVTSEQ